MARSSVSRALFSSCVRRADDALFEVNSGNALSAVKPARRPSQNAELVRPNPLPTAASMLSASP